MLRKIRTSEVRPGMFVHSLEGSWLGHNLWRQRFFVEDATLAERVQRSGASECTIDLSRGIDLGGAQTQTPAPPAIEAPPPAEPVATVPLEAELRNAAALIERSRTVVTNMFRDVRLGNAVDVSRCEDLVQDVVASVDRNAEAMVSLARLKLADEYTYMHSVAVCALMIAVGRKLGLDEDQCRVAGMAGLLHDMGKALMPQEIINKPGKLTDEEFAIIRTHPARGHELLLRTGRHDEGVLDVCLHHHERIDGTGYPDALPADRITLIARMGAVCDVYDAVTSNRPYKAGWDPAEAIAQMAKWKGHLDPEVLRALIKSVGIYPTGALVRLVSGRLAVVTSQTPGKPTLPQVKIFFSTRSNLPLRPELLDLSLSHVSERILEREDPEKWPFDYLNGLWAGDAPIVRQLDRREGVAR